MPASPAAPPRPHRPRGARSAALGLVWSAFALAAAANAVDELRVGAASSLREPLEASARAFEARRPELRVRVVYASSSALAAQVRAGARLDLLLSADARIAHALAEEGHVGVPRVFARNHLVVLGRSGIAALASAAGLLAPQIRRLALPLPAVPAGHYAREWLAAHALLDALALRIVATEHARATLLAVDRGLVDAAIVYATDALLARKAHPIWRIPDSQQPRIDYAAAVLRTSSARDAAQGFAAFLGEGEGRALLAAAGFESGESR